MDSANYGTSGIQRLRNMSHEFDGMYDGGDNRSFGYRIRSLICDVERELRESTDFCKRVELAVSKGVDVTLFGAEYTPYPKGKDGQPILLGQKVYGEDGREWTVLRIIVGKRHCIVGNDGSETKEMLPEWLSHDQPETVRTVVSELVEEAWKAFCRGVTLSELEVKGAFDGYADRLELKRPCACESSDVVADGRYVGNRWLDMDEEVRA